MVASCAPLLGTWPTTQACAQTGNRTDEPLVRRPALNPLSHTSQGRILLSFLLLSGVSAVACHPDPFRSRCIRCSRCLSFASFSLTAWLEVYPYQVYWSFSWIDFLFYISLIFALCYFYLSTLDLICYSFGFLMYKFTLLIWDLSSFLIHILNSIKFYLNIA